MKRTRDDEDSAPVKPCQFCGKTFKARGISLHLNYCKSKAPPRSPRAIKFYIINEHIFKYVLSFLSNQSLTKLQAITGDRYPNCDRHLSMYCCPCENDNPAINRGLCLDCESKRADFKPRITTTEARTLYCVQDLSKVPCDKQKRYTLFTRVHLDKHMVDLYGSKTAWLKAINTKVTRAKTRAAIKLERLKALHAYPAGFEVYLKSIGFDEPNSECAERFVALSESLEARGLDLRVDSRVCERYIVLGVGSVEMIVDTIEEMEFLISHTTYARNCEILMNALHKDIDDFGIHREVIKACREETKMQLCIEYLSDNGGLMLPRKWERCRPRFQEVKAIGMNPDDMICYIYSDGFL